MAHSHADRPERGTGRQITLIGCPYARVRYSYWFPAICVVIVAALLLDFAWGIRLVPFVLVGMPAYLVALVCSQWAARHRLAGYLEREGDPDLVCFGNAEDLDAMSDLDGVSLEPFVAQTTALYHTPAGVVVTIIAGIFVAVLIILEPRNPRTFAVFLIVLAAYSFASWFLFSTYIRVAPQIIEVLHFGPFRRKPRQREFILLNDARIECHFESRKLLVRPHIGDAEEKVISFADIRDSRAFARAVFASAMASQTMPSLPEDELTG